MDDDKPEDIKPEAIERSLPSLENLREALAAQKWNDDLKPAFEPMAQPRVTDRLGRGYYGEDIMARAVTGRGEIILDYASGIEDTNKGGADLVTLAEDDRGLVVKFYDNKALTTRKNVSSVTALDDNFDTNLAYLKTEWAAIVDDPKRLDAEKQLFKAALQAVNEAEGARISRVVTNANGRVEGLTDRVAATGAIIEDLKDPSRIARTDTTVSAFDPNAGPAPGGPLEPPAGGLGPRHTPR